MIMSIRTEQTKRYLLNILLSLLFCFAFISDALCVEPDTLHEYRIKSGFIYNLTMFVDWPEKAFSKKTDPFTICFTNKDIVGEAFQNLLNKKIKGRKIVLKDCLGLDAGFSLQHILFINSDDRKFVKNILLKVGKKNVLTVGEMKGFAEMGGMINIIKKDNKFCLEVNVEAAELAGLKISSKILKLKTIRIVTNINQKQDHIVEKILEPLQPQGESTPGSKGME